jgi:hypothetical protein
MLHSVHVVNTTMALELGYDIARNNADLKHEGSIQLPYCLCEHKQLWVAGG